MKATQCTVNDCIKPATIRGWCNAHYLRWQRHGDPLGGGRPRDGGQGCAVEGCDRPHFACGWCVRHYARERLTGSTGSVDIRPYGGQECQVDGCTEPSRGQGFCNKHYLRWRNHGDPINLPSPTVYAGEDHPAWKGASITYGRAHTRIVDQKGSASQHECQNCGGQAEDWAYLHGSPDEQRDERGRPYSADPEYYAPMCRSCHKTFDNAMR